MTIQFELQELFSERVWGKIQMKAEEDNVPPILVVRDLAISKLKEGGDESGGVDLDEKVGAMAEISGRTASALNRAGIYTLEQLLTLTLNELGDINNVGSKSKKEIVDALEARGLGEEDLGTVEAELDEKSEKEEPDEEDAEEDSEEDSEEEEGEEDSEEEEGEEDSEEEDDDEKDKEEEDAASILEEEEDESIVDEFDELAEQAASDDEEKAVAAVKSAVRLYAPYTGVEDSKQAKKAVAQEITKKGFKPKDPETYVGAVELLREKLPVEEAQLAEIKSLGNELGWSKKKVAKEEPKDRFGVDAISGLTVGQAEKYIEALQDEIDSGDQPDEDLDDFF